MTYMGYNEYYNAGDPPDLADVMEGAATIQGYQDGFYKNPNKYYYHSRHYAHPMVTTAYLRTYHDGMMDRKLAAGEITRDVWYEYQAADMYMNRPPWRMYDYTENELKGSV